MQSNLEETGSLTSNSGKVSAAKSALMMEELRKSAKLEFQETQTSFKFDKINRFRNNEGQDYLSSGIGYIFMTRPHLNIKDNSSINDNFLLSLKNGGSELSKYIVSCLDYGSETEFTNVFIDLITNSAEHFETKDTILKTKELGDTFTGNKLSWGESLNESINADSFTIEYTEYSDMSLTILHKAWVDYIHNVRVNKMTPYRRYIADKVLDYAVSVYYFLLDVDGTTIKYWAKYTGVFPISIPYSAMSFELGESKLKKLAIQYQYSFKDDMDPLILEEFAKLTSGAGGTTSNNLSLKNTWCSNVKISTDRRRLLFDL